MAALDSALPCPLPARTADDADALNEYRDRLGDDRTFARARRRLREDADWASMAKLLVEHAAARGLIISTRPHLATATVPVVRAASSERPLSAASVN